MAGINQATVVGNVGQEIELRYSAAGTAVANVSVATSDKYKDVETTEWHRIVCFGKTAELCQQWVKKGDQVGFTGKIQTRKWTDKQGNDRYSTEIVANQMFLMPNKRSDSDQQRPSRPDDHGPTNKPAPAEPPLDDGFDDIPF